MATGARGEATIVLSDTEQRAVLFTNRALADAERMTGKTVLQLVTAAGRGELGMADTAALLLVGMENARRDAKVGGRSFIIGDAYDVMDQVGFAECARAVMEALAAVVAYERPDNEHPPA